jgi:hypothetical protein
VANVERTPEIAGKISANPNPIPFGQTCVLISWETNDPTGAEIRVSISSGTEKLVSRGQSGSVEIPWINEAAEYDFRVYAASHPGRALDSVQVRRTSSQSILRELTAEVKRGNIDLWELSKFIATAMACYLPRRKLREVFPLWEQHGFHVTPVHFYQPIPDTRSLPETIWSRPSKLVGIDMNDSVQLDLLRRKFPTFRDEYEQLPTEPTEEAARFYLNNGLFGGIDALVAYCMVRHFQPRLIIEIGSGFSSLILGQALAKSVHPKLICIDPYLKEFLKQGFPGLGSVIEKPVQDIHTDFFSQLDPGDILFIDSSHTVKIDGDVNYLFLEVVPRLKPGVIVHVHDIFLPFEYRRDWVMDEFRFWTEQYLLQAFLTFNSEFEVLMANNYARHYFEKELKATFPSLASWDGGSFWIRRKLPVDST